MHMAKPKKSLKESPPMTEARKMTPCSDASWIKTMEGKVVADQEKAEEIQREVETKATEDMLKKVLKGEKEVPTPSAAPAPRPSRAARISSYGSSSYSVVGSTASAPRKSSPPPGVSRASTAHAGAVRGRARGGRRNGSAQPHVRRVTAHTRTRRKPSAAPSRRDTDIMMVDPDAGDRYTAKYAQVVDDMAFDLEALYEVPRTHVVRVTPTSFDFKTDLDRDAIKAFINERVHKSFRIYLNRRTFRIRLPRMVSADCPRPPRSGPPMSKNAQTSRRRKIPMVPRVKMEAHNDAPRRPGARRTKQPTAPSARGRVKKFSSGVIPRAVAAPAEPPFSEWPIRPSHFPEPAPRAPQTAVSARADRSGAAQSTYLLARPKRRAQPTKDVVRATDTILPVPTSCPVFSAASVVHMSTLFTSIGGLLASPAPPVIYRVVTGPTPQIRATSA